MKKNFLDFFNQTNFLKLFAAVFVSELGGYLTNTVILFYINAETKGDMFYLGLSQALFVGPLALGTIFGGSLGESFNRRKIMLLCEIANLFLITSLIFIDYVLPLILIRALVVFFAGVYNPSRAAIVQEVIDPHHLRTANASFTSQTAILHCVGPVLGAWAFHFFGGVKEIFMINAITYAVGILFLYKLQYSRHEIRGFNIKSILTDVKDGFHYVVGRHDLFALLKSFSLGGVLLGIFFPTLLPFIAEIFAGNETTYGQLMTAFGIGGILGSAGSPFILRLAQKGKILVSVAIVQSLTLFLWTQMSSLYLSLAMLFVWGFGMMVLATTYVNYIQSNVSRQYQSRAFSIYDQSISLSVVAGAAVVTLLGNSVSAYELLTASALCAFIILVLRLATQGIRTLYKMET